MRNNSHEHAAFTAGMTGFVLGALGIVAYLLAHDQKKQENIKQTVSDAKKITTQALDQLREHISQEADSVEDELQDLRKNDHGLTVH